MWHPASLLILWGGFAFLLQLLPLPWRLPLAGASLMLGFLLAPDRCWRMLKRSRWLLLSLAVLFAFFTPGEYVSGLAGKLGVTRDGLRLGIEQLSLIVAMLASLALLHDHAGTQGLLAGLYWLLGWHAGRAKTIVRLMLVLEYVEGSRERSWRDWLAGAGDGVPASDGDVLGFPYVPVGWHDKSVIALILLGVMFWMVFR